MKKILCTLFAGWLTLNAIAQQAPNLVAHWEFNNGSTVETINGWTSAVTGTPTATAGINGKANRALKFNQGDYLRIASHPKMNLTSWTIMVTLRPDGFYNGICEDNAIIWRGGEGSAQHMSMRYSDNPYDAGCGTYTPTNSIFISSPAASPGFSKEDWYQSHTPANPFITANRWYCVAGMYDGIAGTITMFVDGMQVTAALPWANQYSFGSAVNDLFIGSAHEPTGNWPYFLNAAIDDIKIYNGVFTLGNEATLPCATTDPVSVQSSSVQPALNIFPNPATDNITIAVPTHLQAGKVTITNAVGAVVKEFSAIQSTIDTHELPAGLYIARIQHNNEIAIGKFTIAR